MRHAASVAAPILKGARPAARNRLFHQLGDAEAVAANLLRADLTGANLAGANLDKAENLSQPQLDEACVAKGGSAPKLPAGFNPPTKICGWF